VEKDQCPSLSEKKANCGQKTNGPRGLKTYWERKKSRTPSLQCNQKKRNLREGMKGRLRCPYWNLLRAPGQKGNFTTGNEKGERSQKHSTVGPNSNDPGNKAKKGRWAGPNSRRTRKKNGSLAGSMKNRDGPWEGKNCGRTSKNGGTPSQCNKETGNPLNN